MFALAVHYRNGLASLDPTECSVPLLFATVSAAAGGAYLAERLRLRRANNPGPPSGVAAADATAADATAASPTAASSTAAAATADAAGCCGTPNTTFRFSKWFIGLVLGFAVAGWVAELGMFAGRFESAASPIACDLWADDPEAFERCTNETREFATLERNWSPMDAGRNYSEPRPDHRALMPALVCIQALTSHAFEHDHLSRCMTFLQNGGQLPDGGVVNAKSLTNDRDFDAPYMVVAMESLRRTRLKASLMAECCGAVAATCKRKRHHQVCGCVCFLPPGGAERALAFGCLRSASRHSPHKYRDDGPHTCLRYARAPSGSVLNTGPHATPLTRENEEKEFGSKKYACSAFVDVIGSCCAAQAASRLDALLHRSIHAAAVSSSGAPCVADACQFWLHTQGC